MHRMKKKLLKQCSSRGSYLFPEFLEKRYALSGVSYEPPSFWRSTDPSEELWQSMIPEDKQNGYAASIMIKNPSTADYEVSAKYQLNVDDEQEIDLGGEQDAGGVSFFEALGNKSTIALNQPGLAGRVVRPEFVLYQAKSNEATPIVIYFHGGGFVGGSKWEVKKKIPVRRLLDQGISVMSVNYRTASSLAIYARLKEFVQGVKGSSVFTLNDFNSNQVDFVDIEEFVTSEAFKTKWPRLAEGFGVAIDELKQFVGEVVYQCEGYLRLLDELNAGRFLQGNEYVNVDVTRVGLAGSSAGAIIASQLGDHLGVKAVAVSQQPLFTSNLLVDGSLVGEKAFSTEFVSDLTEIGRVVFGVEEGIARTAVWSRASLAERDGAELPPLMVYQESGTDARWGILGAKSLRVEMLHHPENARRLERLYQQVPSILFEIYGTPSNHLPLPVSRDLAEASQDLNPKLKTAEFFLGIFSA